MTNETPHDGESAQETAKRLRGLFEVAALAGFGVKPYVSVLLQTDDCNRLVEILRREERRSGPSLEQ
jgi:hypothetical protein